MPKTETLFGLAEQPYRKHRAINGNQNAKTFQSETVEWGTPPQFFREVDSEFHFTIDVCASEWNHKCKRYFPKEQDGLRQSWASEVCWMNPPYGEEIALWVSKARAESKKGATVVCLLPSRTGTKWFHDYILPYAEIRWLRGRPHFVSSVGVKGPAPMAVFLAVFRATEEAHSL